jgi:hypothetical protein
MYLSPLETQDFQGQIRLLQQGLPLPSVLGSYQGFQQIVQVAFDAFTQDEAAIAGEFTGMVARRENQIIRFRDDDQFLSSRHMRP